MPQSLDIECGSDNKPALLLYHLREGNNAPSAIGAFNRLKRMLSDAQCDMTAAGIEQFIHLPTGAELYEMGKAISRNLKEYDAPTWYEWRQREWGTKWNAYGQYRIDSQRIGFLTAWAGVPNLIQILATKNQELDFLYQFADEDWGMNTGSYEYQNGECVSAYVGGNSPEANAIAKELLGEEQNEW